MSVKVRKEYYSRIVSDVHALVATTAAIITVYYSCDDHYQTIFTSLECINKPKLVALYIITISSAYCVYDIYICLIEIKFTAFECKDYIFHHVVGVLGALLVLVSGQFPVALSVGNLVSETSNFCMNFRWRLLKHKITEGSLFLFASILFMVVFFFSRVVFMLLLVIRTF